MYLKRLFLAFFFLASFLNLSSQGLKSFKLQNGLQVYVWEDTTQTEVFGMVSVKAGSVDDPENYTGLAHYLEHLMFKGSQTIGAHNWAEERFVYDSIIVKYDKRVNIKDPDKRRKIDLDINRLNVRQASLSNQNEFWSLVQSMGGQNLNAGTNYDYTVYYNSFPKNELNRWLELYSSRFINPVFRSFQTELETVYEEYNMYQDNPWDNIRNKVFKNSFNEHPYSRAIIGLPEHLKNPQISQLIKFYETWYVPSNMALILVGDIETRKVARTINAKFSRLPANPDTEKKENEIETIEGREQIKESGAPVPVLELVFNGVKLGHSDEIALEVTANLLSNSSQTGLLDRLQLEGDILGCGAYLNSMADGGRFMIEVVPRFDYNQRRYESHKYVEKLVVQELDKLRNGDVEDDFLETVKASMNRNYIRSLENPMSKGMMISEAFISNSGPERILGYPDRLAAVGYEDISRVVSKYLNDNFLAIHIDASENKDKPDKLEKPDLPETPVSNSKEESYYAKLFKNIPTPEVEMGSLEFDDIKIGTINEKSKVYYYPNPENDIFSMVIKYGVGTRELPEIKYAIELMNSAGVLGNFKPQEFRKELSKLNATVSYSADEDYTYVYVEGAEANIVEVCGLMTRQILMPALDEKQIDNIKGGEYQSRIIEKETLDAKAEAMRQFLTYGKESSFLERMELEDVLELTISDLTKAFQKATSFEAEIHYTGQLEFDLVNQLLNSHLPLKETELDSKSPVIREKRHGVDNQVFVCHDSKASQSRIYFYTPGPEFDVDDEPFRQAFNAYFDGGFTGLVTDRIRVQNSMAYSTAGLFFPAEQRGNPMHFVGFIGTQADKTNDAIDLFMDLVRDMPENEYRIEGIKSYLTNSLQSMEPHFRTFTREFVDWQRQGYDQMPVRRLIPDIKELKFEDITNYYHKYLKKRPVVIGIVGNTNDFDVKALEKYGEVERIRENDLFN